jgi:hypothetical protein
VQADGAVPERDWSGESVRKRFEFLALGGISPKPPNHERVEALQVRSRELPVVRAGVFPDTLLQLAMRVEFLSRRARTTLLEMVLAALQPLFVDRHDRGRPADRGRTTAGASRRCRAMTSSVWAAS